MIYLDNAATTYPKPEEVYLELDKANRNAFNTGRGSYKVAREASVMKEEVRKKILKLNNIMHGKVVYTNSATDALNHLIFGVDLKDGDNVYISPFEHNSIIRPLEELKNRINIKIIILPFDKKTWLPDLEKIKNLFAVNNPKLILLSHISNVTGYILPYQEIFALASKYNAIHILDSSQGYGVVPITNLDNISYIVFAGHKSLYASFGIAGYIKLKGDILKPNIFGGTGSDTMNSKMPTTVPDGYEAGSPNIVAICGLNASIDWLNKHNVYNHEKELTHYLIDALKSIKNIKLFIPEKYDNIFGVISMAVDNYTSEDVGKILDDEFDICVRTGYHCAPLVHEFIESMPYNGTVRIGLSHFTTKKEIDELIRSLKTL